VREDALVLYGFADTDERQLYRQLIAVSGVGPKLALACLSGMDAVALGNALADKDVKKLSGVPGIGKRTAERLILELEGKVHAKRAPRPESAPSRNPDLDDLDSALRNLGYKARDVDLLIEGLRPQAAGMSFETLLREALRRLNNG
jgi:Holliday junction DNA helicase RuvA